MSARTTGRAVTAYLWRFKKTVLIVLALLPMAWPMYEAVRTGDYAVGIVAALIVILVVVIVERLLFSKLPNGRDVTVHYLELAALVDACHHDQVLRYKGAAEVGTPDQAVFLCRRRGLRRGFLRLNTNDVELPQIDAEGWVSAEDFVFLPGTNLVFQLPTACMIDDDGPYLPVDQRPRFDGTKGLLFRFRTGHGFATAGALRELVHQLRKAVPVEPAGS